MMKSEFGGSCSHRLVSVPPSGIMCLLDGCARTRRVWLRQYSHFHRPNPPRSPTYSYSTTYPVFVSCSSYYYSDGAYEGDRLYASRARCVRMYSKQKMQEMKETLNQHAHNSTRTLVRLWIQVAQAKLRAEREEARYERRGA